MESILDKKSTSLFWILIISKLFERFVYYGWRSIIFYILVENVVDTGAQSQESVLATYGLIIGLIALASLAGAIAADHFKSNVKIAYVGFILVALGFATTWMFTNNFYFVPIIVITIGIGIVSPNLTTLFGKLYMSQSQKLVRSFSAHYLIVNLGAFLSPILMVFISDAVGYFPAILILGICSLIPILLIHIFRNDLEAIEVNSVDNSISKISSFKIIGFMTLFVFVFGMIYQLFWGTIGDRPVGADFSNEIVQFQGFALGITFISLIVFLFVRPKSSKIYNKIFLISGGAILLLSLWLELIIAMNLQSYIHFFFFITLLTIVEAAILPLALSLLVKFKIHYLTTAIAIVGTGLFGQVPELLFNNLNFANNKPLLIATPIVLIGLLILSVLKLHMHFKIIDASSSPTADHP